MVSIFIRTYKNDLKWLSYCLESIHKNLKGWNEIVIVIPENQKHLLSHLTQEKVYGCKMYKDDYLGQQVTKIKAYRYVENNYVLFVDSDVIFKKGADVKDYFHNDKPVILKQHYSLVGDAKIWKPITEKFFQENIDFEYMRRAPQMFKTNTLEKINILYPYLEDYIISQPKHKFSEFNVLGFYVENMQKSEYEIIDISNGIPEWLPENKCKQFWSWGGITKEIETEINKLINGN